MLYVLADVTAPESEPEFEKMIGVSMSQLFPMFLNDLGITFKQSND